MHLIPAAVIGLLLIPAAWAQQANVNLDWNPQEDTEGLTPFSAPLNSPDVHDDGRVTFRVRAPEAESVALNGAILAAFGRSWGETMPFSPGEDGIWTLTVGPVRPDIYAYLIRIDGVQVADPANTIAAFTGMPPYSQLVVHGDGPAYYDARNVPHGAITRHMYHSNVTHGERDLYVYTPPGYDPSRDYPVLYLMGGSGELPHNWIHDGRANFILDNLLAEDRAEPMLIVVPNNQVIHRNHPRHAELTFDLLERELREHVIPLVDGAYATIASPRGRALSGLSMGGRHTMVVGLTSLDLFGSFGILSAGAGNAEEVLADFLHDPQANDKVDYLFIGQGKMEAEGRWNARVQGLIDALKAHEIEYEYQVSGYTAHDWATWRALLHEHLLPKLWRHLEDGTVYPLDAPDEPNAIPLNTGGVDDQPATESWFRQWGEPMVRNVTQATLTPYLPDPAKASGAAVIVAPGGGYRWLSINNEGWKIADALRERGVAAFVLKYRLNPTPPAMADFKAMMEGGGGPPPPSADGEAPAPRPRREFSLSNQLEDAEAAYAMILERAEEWGVDTDRIGMMGFSAGAGLTMHSLLNSETMKLSFVAPIYGGMGPVDVPEDAPPLFAAIAVDDFLFRGQFGLIKSWYDAGKPVEFHLYQDGGHGFGMGYPGHPTEHWFEPFTHWLDHNGYLKPAP